MSEQKKSELRMVSVMEVIIAVIIILILLLFYQTQQFDNELSPIREELLKLREENRGLETKIDEYKGKVNELERKLNAALDDAKFWEQLARKDPKLVGEDLVKQIKSCRKDREDDRWTLKGLKDKCGDLELGRPPCSFAGTTVFPHGRIYKSSEGWSLTLSRQILEHEYASELQSEMLAAEGFGDLIRGKTMTKANFFRLAKSADKAVRKKGCAYYASVDTKYMDVEDIKEIERYFYKAGW